MVVTAPWDSRLMVAHPQLYRVIRHIIKGMKLLLPDPTQIHLPVLDSYEQLLSPS